MVMRRVLSGFPGWKENYLLSSEDVLILERLRNSANISGTRSSPQQKSGMQDNDRIRLKHMLEAAEEALLFARGKSRKDLDHNRQLVLAIIRDVEIIGEAADKISDEVRSGYPEIPWLDIINMRHHLAHVYYDVDLNIVWDTVVKDLPDLVRLLKPVL